MGALEYVAAESPLLQALSAAAQAQIIAHGRQHYVPAEAYFFHQGDDSTTLYVLLSGQVKLSQLSPEGEQVIVNYFGPGDGLGIVVALSQIPYPLSAQAVEASTALAWDRATMRDLMRQYPQLALNGLDMVGRRFADLQNRFGDLATKRVQQRVARALLRLIRQFGRRDGEHIILTVSLTREDLAQMTGTNLYQVSRILSDWTRSGMLQTERQQIAVLRPHELVAIAEDLPPRGGPAPGDGPVVE